MNFFFTKKALTLEEAKKKLLHECRDDGSDDVGKVRDLLSQYPSLLNEDLDGKGWTVLIFASFNKLFKIVKYLLSIPDININQQNSYGWTALYVASYKGRVNVVQELLSHPAIDVNIKDKKGKTPMEVCCDGTDKFNQPEIIWLFENHRIAKEAAALTSPTPKKKEEEASPIFPKSPPQPPASPTLSKPSSLPSTTSPSPAIEGGTAASVTTHSAAIKEVGVCRRLLFPPLLQLSFIHLKLLLLKDELVSARAMKNYQRIASLGEEKQQWTSWQEELLREMQKGLPSELSSEEFYVVKEFVLQQLDTHFDSSLSAGAKVLEGIDTFKESVVSMEICSGRKTSLNPPRVKDKEGSQKADLSPFPLPQLPLPPGKVTHVFLTHTWRKDEEGRDTHDRVRKINNALKSRGIIAWFDEERMTGTVRDVMAEALYSTCCVLIFITREYETKINSRDDSDNCYYEFNVAANETGLVNNRIPVVMDKSMLNPHAWKGGRLKAEMGGKLFIDLSSDEESVFNARCDEIAGRVRERLTAQYAGIF